MIASAFAMSFDTWPPNIAPVKHGIPAPLGAIRLATKGKSRGRMIKVRMDGPPSRRWMRLARFWWIRNKGAVPVGKRVGYFDGDTLNDDPRNYALFTAGDIIASHHLDNPAWSRRQHLRAAKGCGEWNRAQAMLRRTLGLLPSRWYAVDLQRQIIVNEPRRKRWQVCDDPGVGPLVPMRGADLAGEEYRHFQRIWPDGAPVASVLPLRSTFQSPRAEAVA